MGRTLQAGKYMALKKQETVFLCGTDKAQDIFDMLYKRLKDMGFRPYWFRKPDFPHLINDAMENCLEVARQSDRMIIIIDEKAGLSYGNTGKTISEAEFDTCSKKGIPILAFVRDNVWYHSKIYHRHLKKQGKITEKYFDKLMLDGDQNVHNFIEHLQHNTVNGKKQIPWIDHFALPESILIAVQEKWILSRERQENLLSILKDSINIGKIPIRGRNIKFMPEAKQALMRLDNDTSSKITYALKCIHDGSPRSILESYNLKWLSSDRQEQCIRIGKTRIKFRLEPNGGMTILSIENKP